MDLWGPGFESPHLHHDPKARPVGRAFSFGMGTLSAEKPSFLRRDTLNQATDTYQGRFSDRPCAVGVGISSRMNTTVISREAIEAAIPVVERGRRAKWWRRRGSKERGFWYVDPRGNRITDEVELQRIKSLVIPPAWKEARICPSPNGNLQAVGLDKNGRIQYLYHPGFAARRQQAKYEKIEKFGERLPLIRRMTNEHLEQEGFPRERVLALMIRLINELHFRLGTDGSVQNYRTYGITTLRNRHLTIRPRGVLEFNFVAKHHIRQRQIMVDSDLAALMCELKEIGGARLFEYFDLDGRVKPVLPRDINTYIKSCLGTEYSAKDFRTWAGTLHAATVLAELGPAESEREIKRNIVAAVKKVAEKLGNTPSVCRGCYIHPVVFERYQAGITLEQFRPRAERLTRRRMPDYEPEELSLLALFRARTSPTESEASALVEMACEAVVEETLPAAA